MKRARYTTDASGNVREVPVPASEREEREDREREWARMVAKKREAEAPIHTGVYL